MTTSTVNEINELPPVDDKPKRPYLYTNDDGAVVVDREKLIEYMLEKVPTVTGSFFTKIIAIYNGQHWDKLPETTAKSQLKAEVIQELWGAGERKKARNGFVNEVVETILGIAHQKQNPFETADPHKISFKNGTYDIKRDILDDNKPTDYILHGLDYDLDTSGRDTPVSDYVLNLYFGDSAQFIREFLGYGFVDGYSYHQTIIIQKGAPGTGKSNLLMNRLVRPLFAPIHKNISNIKMEQLTGDGGQSSRFNQKKLDGKMINLAPDLTGTIYIQNADQLKALASGEPIEAENKGENAVSFVNGTKLMFTGNDIPRMKLDNALKSRIKVVPVVASVIRGNENASNQRFASAPVSKLTDERGALAYNLMRDFWKTAGGTMTINDAITQATQEWFAENDPLEAFISEHLTTTSDGTGISVAYLFDRLTDWLDDNGFKSHLTRITFTKAMKELGYETKNTTAGTDDQGKQAWRFVGYDYEP